MKYSKFLDPVQKQLTVIGSYSRAKLGVYYENIQTSLKMKNIVQPF